LLHFDHHVLKIFHRRPKGISHAIHIIKKTSNHDGLKRLPVAYHKYFLLGNFQSDVLGQCQPGDNLDRLADG